MKKVSAVLISFNEEAKIGVALASLGGIADEIIVVDSFSTDNTPEICRTYTDNFFQLPWAGYLQQKREATSRSQHEWVLSLDADEVIGSKLRGELLAWKQEPDQGFSGYLLPRKTFFMGRWIQHTSWYPDRQLRLFRKNHGNWTGGRIHESVKIEGRVGSFKGFIEHYTYSSISEYLEQLERFSSLAAADKCDQHRSSGWVQIAFNPPVVFFRNYILQLGFLDGLPGFVVSALCAISVFFKNLKLWELHRSGKTSEASR